MKKILIAMFSIALCAPAVQAQTQNQTPRTGTMRGNGTSTQPTRRLDQPGTELRPDGSRDLNRMNDRPLENRNNGGTPMNTLPTTPPMNTTPINTLPPTPTSPNIPPTNTPPMGTPQVR